MEVKEGYKRTELGVIPADWAFVLLDSVSQRGSGHTPDKKQARYWDGVVPWISLADSPSLDKRYIGETAACVTPEGIANSSAVIHPLGTVLISRDAGVGKSAIMKRAMAVSQHFVTWRCGTSLCNQFLYYWLQSAKPNFERIAVGSTIKTIGLPHFASLRIPLPPLPEQKAIAEALSDVDDLIASLERLIAKKRDIKAATMGQLLTGRTRLPGFTGEWERKRLGEVGSTYGGLSGKTRADFGSGSAQYVTFMNVMTNVVIDCGSFEQVRVSANESQNRVHKGDLLFNGSSETPEEVAMCSLMAEDVSNLFLNSFCFGFRLSDEQQVDRLFLAYYIRAAPGRELMKALAQGSTRYNISKSALLEAPIRVPVRAEQQAVAAVLSDMDAEIEALQARLDKTRMLKQGMMQELLTGRTRLV
jgi:type I restriction enzyme S subunit